MTPVELAQEIRRRADPIINGGGRFITALAGAPGAGKSTLATDLVGALGTGARVVPMDGFHLLDETLVASGLRARKGAPETFDARGFIDIVHALKRAEGEVLVPVFDRSREIALNAARAIPRETRFILAEGNYLLFKDAPWDRLEGVFDFTIFVGPPYPVLEERLRRRWQGYALPEDQIGWKLYGNDLPNGKRILENSRPADLHIDIF